MRFHTLLLLLIAVLPLKLEHAARAQDRHLADEKPIEEFRLGGESEQVHVWGRGAELPRVYFYEFLPALFERTLTFNRLALNGAALEWIFTGDHGGFTVRIDASEIRVSQRFYDSFGFNSIENDSRVRASRHPEKRWVESVQTLDGLPRKLTVRLDHRLGLSVALDGREVVRQVCLFDVSRHQLRLTGKTGEVRGGLLKPAVKRATVRIDRRRRYQKIIGFGGIATPTAYAQLSPEGKRRWWQLVAEYNLLIQREYPIGTRLNPEMNNWDVLRDATPHYYGDNFPNGEISDFNYIRTLRRLGGKVLFEFWGLPPWTKREWKDSRGKKLTVADPEKYARAMVRYCQVSRERAGAPPDVVGIQNERSQPPEVWHEMVLALRRGLDRAGFQSVKIHMSDAGSLAGGLRRAAAFRRSKQAWAAIDFAATHMYDYQNSFGDPDRYDALLDKWKQLTDGKPFLSTELCVNSPRYQRQTYRLAFQMGQLYHKNLVLADASAVLYCWVLLNVVQPSYGWTRTLFVPDRAHGFVPTPSSYQLRVYGAFSRRISAGMVRVAARSSDSNLLASAYVGGGDAATVVLLNRSTSPQNVRIEGAGTAFRDMEIVSPYRENEVRRAPDSGKDGTTNVRVDPGEIVTLSNIPLGKAPPDSGILP